MTNLPLKISTLAIAFVMTTGTAISQEAASKAKPQDWIQLFNGKNLDGWTVKITKHKINDNFGNTFRVENGLLKVSYDHYDKLDGQFGHLFYKDKFSYYLIAVEYRFVGEQAKGAPDWAYRNNGIMIHSQSPESMGLDQDFPTSIEVQLLGGDGTHDRPNGNVCTPGTNIVIDGELFTPHCYHLAAKTYHGDQWVRVVAQVLGSERITHYVQGVPVRDLLETPVGRRTNESGVREAGRRTPERGLYCASGRERSNRVSQGRTPQPYRLHGQQSLKLQTLLCKS